MANMCTQFIDIVTIDHCYSKPHSAHPDASNAQPLRTIFMEKFPRNKSLEMQIVESDGQLDVVSVSSRAPAVYDISKTRAIMNETEKQLSTLPDDKGDDWDDKINRVGWLPQQNRLFNKVNKVLLGDRLARLAYENRPNEAVLRRIQVDKTAKRFRQILAGAKWEARHIQWLHGVLLDNLNAPLLATYIDVLQTLRAKIPNLIDHMVSVGGVTTRSQVLTGELLNNLTKKPWDPIITAYSQNKMKKLPGNPLILIAPSGPTNSNSQQPKRMRYWTNQLSGMGKVIPVTMHTVNNGSGVSIAQCLEHMIVAVKTKVVELKSHFLNRPIVLMGWNIGALVACQVALKEAVSAVVCLGFPYTGVGGVRGDADDPLLECRTPTLFVIGQHANTSSIDDIEDLREKMKSDNSLLVVGGSDDNLRMSDAKKKLECVTQVMVDKNIVEEISDFLGGILSQNPTMQESLIVDLTESNKRARWNQVDVNDGMDCKEYDKKHVSHQGRMTIAKALRARTGQGSASLDSPFSYTSYGSNITSQIKVKRKYTKRKSVGKTASSVSNLRKRFKSTPTPTAAGSVTSFQTPMTVTSTPTTGVPELTGLLRSQPSLLPTFRIITEEGGQKTTLFSTPQMSMVTAAAAVVAPPSTTVQISYSYPSTIKAGEEPLVAYRLEDYNKQFGTQEKSNIVNNKASITIEDMLQTSSTSSSSLSAAGQYTSSVTNTPISSLLSLARHMPAIHMTTASTVVSQIHQLLSSLSRTQGAINTLSVSASSPSLASLKLPASPQSNDTHQLGSGVHQSAGIRSQVPMSQSGSPLQNSVPTLMSSLAKTTTLTGGNIIRMITSSSTPSEPHHSHGTIGEKVTHAAQKLLFHDLTGSGSDDPQSHVTVNQTLNAVLMPSDSSMSLKQSYYNLPMQLSLDKSSSTVCHTSSLLATQRAAPSIVPITASTKPCAPMILSSSLTLGGHTYSEKPVGMQGVASSLLELSTVTERLPGSSVGSQLPGFSVGMSGSSVGTQLPSSSVGSQLPGSSVGTQADDSSIQTKIQPVNISVVMTQKTTTVRTPSTASTSYAVTPKASIATLASTRTRRIRTPKQFDL